MESEEASLLLIIQDQYVLALLHLVLLGFVLYSIFASVRTKLKSGPNLKVIRGEKSMTYLYVIYGVITLIFALAVQVSRSGEGYKVGIILVDYVFLTYLFFFNSWFRNWLIGKKQRIEED
jgi:hypothetical protein